MEKNYDFEMSNLYSCVQDPQVNLTRALTDKNVNEFKIALEMEADPTRIDNELNISVFEKALQTHGCAEIVAECLKRGCKCDYINRRLNKCPINFAADSKDPKILSQLLRIKNINVDAKYANLTPLNSLAKNITTENFKDAFECIKQLIVFGANPNIPDQREMTPILNIFNNKNIDKTEKQELITFLLEQAQIDLDTFREGEARERLQNHFPQIQLPTENITGPNFEILLTLLRNGHEDKFLESFNDYKLNLSNRDNQKNITQEENIALLLEAIKKSLNNAVEIILRTDVNVNLTYNGNCAVEIACIYGNCKALQYLLNYDDLQLRKFENLLILIIKRLDEPTFNNNADYYGCFYTLLDSPKIDVNEIDKSGSSPLHYAVKYKNVKAIKELLKRGAYIGTRSIFNDLPISEINPELLEDYFDSCITTNELKPGDDGFEIIINYRNLIPNYGNNLKNTKSCTINQEMLPIEHIANSKELKPLLKHPLITSFLFLKWHQLSLIFYINFILFTLFCASLITYIILHFNNTSSEVILTTFKTLSFVGLIYMILRETIQFIISPIMFIRSSVNYLEVILIILTVVTLCDPNYQKETQRVLAVFTILLASVELCLLIGSLPVPSISTHMLMLRAVSKTFLKSFTLYSVFVITFSLCFYILFGKPEDSGPSENDDGNAEGEFNNFVNPFAAIIKTIVMLTGEFDAGDIHFNSFVSYLVFLLFVVFMSIVLFNLLNGLAVSDTQVIKAQAELNGSICRTYLLASYEKVLTGHGGKTAFFVNHQPFRGICKQWTNLFPNHISGGSHIGILPNNSNKILVPAINSRERESLPSKTNGAVFLHMTDDTDRQKKLLDAPVNLMPCCCTCLRGKCSEMDVRTVKAALAVIEKKIKVQKETTKTRDFEIRLEQIEEKTEKIFNLLQEISLKQKLS